MEMKDTIAWQIIKIYKCKLNKGVTCLAGTSASHQRQCCISFEHDVQCKMILSSASRGKLELVLAYQCYRFLA